MLTAGDQKYVVFKTVDITHTILLLMREPTLPTKVLNTNANNVIFWFKKNLRHEQSLMQTFKEDHNFQVLNNFINRFQKYQTSK